MKKMMHHKWGLFWDFRDPFMLGTPLAESTYY